MACKIVTCVYNFAGDHPEFYPFDGTFAEYVSHLQRKSSEIVSLSATRFSRSSAYPAVNCAQSFEAITDGFVIGL